jgi:hypothetical protein|tara:strand:- start:185 stop:364 length:180 start_codon:yes stop_codon:yes gene_type:complete
MKYQITYTLEVNGIEGSLEDIYKCNSLSELRMALETFANSKTVTISNVIINTIVNGQFI